MIALLLSYALAISGTVPPVCGAVIEGNVAHHLCNVPGPYTVTVSSPVPFRYGDRELPAGTHVLTFIGPEKVDRIVEAANDRR
jgi:hypothetical protein